MLAVAHFSCLGQDPQFSQFYAAPVFLNPAFTGNTTQGRFAANYRNQWTALPKAFVSYGASYEYNLINLNSGIGFSAQTDKAGSAGLRYTSISGYYSYLVQVSRKLSVRAGMGFGHVTRDIDYDKLVFGDQLIRGGGATNASALALRRFESEVVNYFDFSSGAVVFTPTYWAGISAHHLNQPNQSLVGGEAQLPLKFSIHGGYNINLQRNVKREVITSITLAANYKSQQRWDQFDFGGYFTYVPFVFGVWYRGINGLKQNGYNTPNHDAITALVGTKYKEFKFGYSYDLTISKLAINTGGSHEVAIIYEHASKNYRKRKRRRSTVLIPCASF